MLASSGSTIGSLLGLALLFATLWEFFRGMRALTDIAAHIGRIENILAEAPPTAPRASASHSAT